MLLSYEEELRLTTKLLSASGLPESDAETVARVVTHSDFTGVYSHGLSRLTAYLSQLSIGSLNPRPAIRKIIDTGAVMAFDCDNGSGVLAVNRVYDALVPKAREYGIAIATGNHSANIGCGAYYGWRAAEDKLICLLCANTYACMAPYGGSDKIIGTNPIVISAPAGEEYPVVLDISTSGVAFGKIVAMLKQNKSIPDGWANDIDGRPTNDPAKAYTVLPIAAHKGYGLAVMVDVFSSVLGRAAYGTDMGLASKLEKENTGFSMILIDPSKFMPIEEFTASMDRYIRMIKGSRKAVGFEEIFMPGEIEYRKFAETRVNGVEISDSIGESLFDCAKDLGLVKNCESFKDMLSM